MKLIKLIKLVGEKPGEMKKTDGALPQAVLEDQTLIRRAADHSLCSRPYNLSGKLGKAVSSDPLVHMQPAHYNVTTSVLFLKKAIQGFTRQIDRLEIVA